MKKGGRASAYRQLWYRIAPQFRGKSGSYCRIFAGLKVPSAVKVPYVRISRYIPVFLRHWEYA